MKTLLPKIPVETYTAAREVYNIQHIYIQIGDHLNHLIAVIDLSLLDPSSRLGYDAVLRLALVSAFQYAELLPDALASLAVQERMDWKYALYLPVNFTGIAAQALCDFRANLYTSPKGLNEFGRLLKLLGKDGLLPHPTNNLPEALEALTTVCRLNRLYWMQQAMKSALGLLVSTAPDWLLGVAQPYWYEYYKSNSGGRMRIDPGRLEEEAHRIGADAAHLLERAGGDLPEAVRARPELRHLALRFKQQYTWQAGRLCWMGPSCGSCACSYPLDTHL